MRKIFFWQLGVTLVILWLYFSILPVNKGVAVWTTYVLTMIFATAVILFFSAVVKEDAVFPFTNPAGAAILVTLVAELLGFVILPEIARVTIPPSPAYIITFGAAWLLVTALLLLVLWGTRSYCRAVARRYCAPCESAEISYIVQLLILTFTFFGVTQ